LSEPKLQLIHLADYLLGASYCRKTFLKGGISIFVQRNLKFNTTKIDEYSTHKDIEACAIRMDSTCNKLCVLAIYRSPSGEFTNFLKQLDLILQKLYKNKHSIIICGDVNVNYLTDNNRRRQLEEVLHSYNLVGIVEFPTRFGGNYQTAIDNVFFDTSTVGKYELYPFRNGLSDHDAQLLINSRKLHENNYNTTNKRKINTNTIADFQWKLSHESWEQIFHGNDVNLIFNSFLNTFLMDLLF